MRNVTQSTGMRRAALPLLTIAALATAPVANALSCKRPNFAEEFNRVAAAPELYSVVYGTLKAVSPIPSYAPGEPRKVAYVMEGRRMGQRGFRGWEDIDFLAQTGCAGEWCGALPPEGHPVLAFLQHEDVGLTLDVPACSTDFTVAPSLGQVTAIRVCLREGTCGADELDAFAE